MTGSHAITAPPAPVHQEQPEDESALPRVLSDSSSNNHPNKFDNQSRSLNDSNSDEKQKKAEAPSHIDPELFFTSPPPIIELPPGMQSGEIEEEDNEPYSPREDVGDYIKSPGNIERKPNHFRIQLNIATGIITSSDGFPTFCVELYGVDDIFTKIRQPWNRKHDNAVRIFGTGISARAIRHTIRMQHASLYNKESCKHSDGTISSGEELLNMLHNGRTKDGVVVLYTYVIMQTCWRFSETGAQFFKDMFSKHALHANCSPEVVFSGEFHFQQTERGFTLIIDNNSGTYAPSKKLLDRLAKVMELNFPGLKVEALDIDDPKLIQYHKSVEIHNAKILQTNKKSSLFS